jgi:hypothetical protein
MVVPSGDGITATVAEREFLGGFTRYRMQAGGNVVVVDVPHRRGAAPHEVGSVVGLSIDPRQMSVLR